MRPFIYISLFLSAMLLSSCGPKVVYEENRVLNSSWSYDETVDFNFNIDDPNKEYDLLLTIVHSVDFSYQNFYTNIVTTYPTQEKFTSPLSIELANKMGSWLSACKGEECKLHLLLRDNVKFKDTGEYNISFIQNTRDKELKGIQSLSLSLIETED